MTQPPQQQKKDLVKPGVSRLKMMIGEEAIRKQFDAVMGKRSEAFISSVIQASNANKMLSECDPMSVISAAMKAATMNLPIDPSLGFAYIVPYNVKGEKLAQFQIGSKGYIQLGIRSGQFLRLNTTPILEGQLVSRNTFTGEFQFQEEATSDKTVGYLLYFKLLNGYEKFVYWTREQCDAHGKKFSQTYKKGLGPWVDNFDAMALKTVVKHGLGKYAPLSIDTEKALIIDGSASREIDGMLIYPDGAVADEHLRDVSPDAPPKKSRLDAVVEATVSNANPEPAASSPDQSSTHPSPEEAAALEIDKMVEKKP